MALVRVRVPVPAHFTFFELGVVHEVFGIDRTDDGVPAFDFAMCVEHPGRPLTGPDGIALTIDRGLDDVAGADLVCVPAFDFHHDATPAIVEAVRAAYDNGATLLSVCSGAFLLGAAGLLDGRRCTTHWRHVDELMERYPDAVVDRDVLFVHDDRVLTSAGTAAGIDACLHLVRDELGAAVATRIARRMVVPPQRDGGQRQFIEQPVPEPSAGDLREVMEWMLANLEREQSVRLLADRAAMSERTFARRFVAETGTTPAKWLQAQRLHHARQLLEHTDLGIETVAARSGFGSAALLRHHFNAAVGVAPGDYRRTFRQAG